jgi:putative thioredoxin
VGLPLAGGAPTINGMNSNPTHDSPWIIDTTQETFERDVIERSHEVPVVVDFWAGWCQPCKLLAPLLEQQARERDGQVLLVKADTESVPQAAMAFRVSSIPAVFAVAGGEVVDGFVGLLPESQLSDWFDRVVHLGQLQRARTLEASQPAEAAAIYRGLLSATHLRSEPQIGLARLALAANDLPSARKIVDELEARGFLEPEAEKLKAALELGANQDVDLDALRGAAGREPDNLQLQLDLGQALAAQQQYQPALEQLLTIVERDKAGLGDQARQIMVDIFRVLSDESELTMEYRRRLSAALY